MPKTAHAKEHGMKTKSMKQVRYLMSKGSPLTPRQMARMRNEMHKGTIKIKG